MRDSTLAERLRQARENKNYTQVQVMQHTGINNKTLSGYEKVTGGKEPDLDTLKLLCDFYEVTIDWALGNTNNPKANLTSDQRRLISKVNLNDDSALDKIVMEIDGREITEQEKQRVLAMVRLLLNKDQQ